MTPTLQNITKNPKAKRITKPEYLKIERKFLQNICGKDVVFIPHTSSNELLIIMSTRNQDFFMALQKLYKIKQSNLLFVKNPDNNFYLENDMGKKYEEVFSYFCKKYKPENITFIGSSMSGYGAIYHGIKQNANIISNIPQIDFNEVLRNDEDIWKSLRKAVNKVPYKVMKLQEYIASNINESIIYSIHGNCKIDTSSYDAIVRNRRIQRLIENGKYIVRFLPNKMEHVWHLGSFHSVYRLHRHLQNKRTKSTIKK